MLGVESNPSPLQSNQIRQLSNHNDVITGKDEEITSCNELCGVKTWCHAHNLLKNQQI